MIEWIIMTSYKQRFMTNNLIWFPSFKLSILVLITLIIEMGIVCIYCTLISLPQDITNILLLLVFCGNILTGLIGWLFANLKGE